jgi:hypothetical protein
VGRYFFSSLEGIEKGDFKEHQGDIIESVLYSAMERMTAIK